MKTKYCGIIGRILIVFFLCNVVAALAIERYVNVNNSSPAAPYLTWATAATTIQAAINAASDGDVITVTNGVYQTGASQLFQNYATNRVSISKALLVRSVNGPAVTIINGGRTMRCVALVNNAVLSGFTLTNGVPPSGGNRDGGGALGDIYSYQSRSATLTNCILTGNATSLGGGAIYCTLIDCVLTNNSAQLNNGFGGGATVACNLNRCLITGNRGEYGGGAFSCTLTDCILTNNYAESGGGAYDSMLSNCTIANNVATLQGGGACQCGLTNCFVIGNTVTNGNGGGVYSVQGNRFSTMVNCVLVNNRASTSNSYGGGLFGAFSSFSVQNCAFTNNSASIGGGVYRAGILQDCILVGNQATNGPGKGGGAALTWLERCVLLENVAKYGGGVLGTTLGDSDLVTTYNCVLGGNTASAPGG